MFKYTSVNNDITKHLDAFSLFTLFNGLLVRLLWAIQFKISFCVQEQGNNVVTSHGRRNVETYLHQLSKHLKSFVFFVLLLQNRWESSLWYRFMLETAKQIHRFQDWRNTEFNMPTQINTYISINMVKNDEQGISHLCRSGKYHK